MVESPFYGERRIFFEKPQFFAHQFLRVFDIGRFVIRRERSDDIFRYFSLEEKIAYAGLTQHAARYRVSHQRLGKRAIVEKTSRLQIPNGRGDDCRSETLSLETIFHLGHAPPAVTEEF